LGLISVSRVRVSDMTRAGRGFAAGVERRRSTWRLFGRGPPAGATVVRARSGLTTAAASAIHFTLANW